MSQPASRVAACLAIFYAAALPLIGTNYDKGRAFRDQTEFHYPAVRHFASGGGIDDYPSATTPGYHWILAGVARLVADNEIVLKLVSSAFTAVLLGMLAWVSGGAKTGDIKTGSGRIGGAAGSLGLLLTLPVVFSIYIFPSGVWLLPDNLAWLTVLCVFLLALRPSGGATWHVLAAAALLAVVLVRQSNLWTVAVLWVAVWTSEPDRRRLPGRLAAMALATLPAAAVAGYFFLRWNGLVPPTFAMRHESANPAAPAFFLAVACFYTAFYLPCIAAALRDRLAGDRKARWLVLAGCLAGLALSLVAPTDWSAAGGRDSGLWNFTLALPVVGHRSTLICLLASLGGGCCVAWFLLASRNGRWVFASAAIAFVASQMLNHSVYERYYAGFVFLMILLLIRDVSASAVPRERLPIWAAAGALLFTAFNGLVLIRGLW